MERQRDGMALAADASALGGSRVGRIPDLLLDRLASSPGLARRRSPAKRIVDPFEEELLKLLGGRGPLWIDKGVGGEEAARVGRAAERAGVAAEFWDGSFAGFASIIAGSPLYVGYDSAGQHVAAAAGVPLISIFAGFPAPRMFDRWRPSGPRCRVIRVDRADPEVVLEQLRNLRFG